MPRNQQIEAEAPELVQGVVGAQKGVCLRTFTWRSDWGFRRSTKAAVSEQGESDWPRGGPHQECKGKELS